MLTLYGDGVHDDYAAIQERLDSGASLIYLPAPEAFYLIGNTLKVHSHQELRLDRYTRIVLKAGSNCAMIENADPETGNEDITISGGVWDMDHRHQNPNPYHFPDPVTGKTGRDLDAETGFSPANDMWRTYYTGHLMRFLRVCRFTIGNLTLVNPVVYGMQLCRITDFTVHDITFDYTEGSPKLWNMDGVHVEGWCKNGVLRNLKGACHDDLVAITSDDGYYGPVENITVDGIFAQGCHSAVRLLSRTLPVDNVHITNVFGTFYVYCITISKYTDEPGVSAFSNITIDNVYASLCRGTVDVPGNYEPLIAIGDKMQIRRLAISHLHRVETHCAQPTIGIKEGTVIDDLILTDCTQENKTDYPMPFLSNKGTVRRLTMIAPDPGTDELITGDGTIEAIHQV